MSERGWHVSSAVVSVRPDMAGTVIERIEAMDRTEIRGQSESRLVVVMEGRTVGELVPTGDNLEQIVAWIVGAPERTRPDESNNSNNGGAT